MTSLNRQITDEIVAELAAHIAEVAPELVSRGQVKVHAIYRGGLRDQFNVSMIGSLEVHGSNLYFDKADGTDYMKEVITAHLFNVWVDKGRPTKKD